MSLTLFECPGGQVVLPDLVLVDREDGGHLCVNPPRDVWERGELMPRELTLWSFLVAATGRAMLAVLPQLEGGCINYWEAGNWALNDKPSPRGRRSLGTIGESTCTCSAGVAARLILRGDGERRRGSRTSPTAGTGRPPSLR